MEPCEISGNLLSDYADGTLDATRRNALAAHLESGCAVCRERLNWLSDALPALNEFAFETPPSRTIQEAHALFREKRHKPSLVATLAQQIFDSRNLTPQLAGARGENDGTFRILYQIEGVEVELYGETTETHDFYLIGQARSMENAAALIPVAAILTPGKPVSYADQQMAMIEGSEFHFSAMQQGVHLLTLWLNDVMLSISGIRVGV